MNISKVWLWRSETFKRLAAVRMPSAIPRVKTKSQTVNLRQASRFLQIKRRILSSRTIEPTGPKVIRDIGQTWWKRVENNCLMQICESPETYSSPFKGWNPQIHPNWQDSQHLLSSCSRSFANRAILSKWSSRRLLVFPQDTKKRTHTDNRCQVAKTVDIGEKSTTSSGNRLDNWEHRKMVQLLIRLLAFLKTMTQMQHVDHNIKVPLALQLTFLKVSL